MSIISCNETKPSSVRYRWRRQTLVAFIAFHLLLSLAFIPWLFSWAGVISFLVGYYFFVLVGIDMTYHRLLSHGSFQVPRWLEYTLATLGVCNLQDTPTFWVANHRRHHQFADEEPDPHSPLSSFFWGHMGWLIRKRPHDGREKVFTKYAPDMLQDPFYSSLERHNLAGFLFLAHALLFYLIGFLLGWVQTSSLLGGLQLGLSLVVWGVIVRVVYGWHIVWAVNSVGHLWGYRNYKTADNSRNNYLISLGSMGSGWHNNHHGDQRSAVHGHYRWWEFDSAYLTILFLRCVGLAWDVIPRRPHISQPPHPNSLCTSKSRLGRGLGTEGGLGVRRLGEGR